MSLLKGLHGLQRRPWRRAAAWLALLAPFFYLSYGLANHLAAARATVPSVVFAWEHHVPFWPWTIFPYWSLNLFYGLSLFVARHRRELDRHAARLLTAQCLAVACFIAFPLHYSFGQPAVDGAAGWLFGALRGFDLPFNQAPSLHVALVVILWDLYRRHLTGAARWLLHGMALLITGSVLTTYQHHFIDIPTGALLGLVCVWAWPLAPRLSMVQAWQRGVEARRRQLAGRYAAGAAAVLMVALAGAAAGQPVLLWLCWPAVSLALVALHYAGLGARGFQLDAQGRMPWATQVLLAPYLLGARVNARTWTRGLPPAREVRPGVWLASLVRWGMAVPRPVAGPHRLLSLCAELPVPSGVATHVQCLPWLDLVPAAPARLRAAAWHVEAAQQRGEPVVVACAVGFSRSVAVVVCWLVRAGHARSVDEALQQVRRVHPRATLDAGWREALQSACSDRPITGSTDEPATSAPALSGRITP